MATDPKNKDQKIGDGELTDEKLEDVAGGRNTTFRDADGSGSDVKPARSDTSGGLDQA